MNRYLSLVRSLTVDILKDRGHRRRAMFYLLVAALVMLFAGVVLVDEFIDPRPVLFLAYWAVCVWLTVTAVLLAIYDLLKESSRRR